MNEIKGRNHVHERISRGLRALAMTGDTLPWVLTERATALDGATTLLGVAGKLMLTAAETKEVASALYPIDMYELARSWALTARKTADCMGKVL